MPTASRLVGYVASMWTLVDSTRPERLRDRDLPRGTQVILSPWHLHRHERLWADPDAFDPARWDSEAGRASARDAYIPFSAGQRVCPGAGFAMIEGPLMLSLIVRGLRLERGSVVPLAAKADTPSLLHVNGVPVASGEVLIDGTRKKSMSSTSPCWRPFPGSRSARRSSQAAGKPSASRACCARSVHRSSCSISRREPPPE